MCITAHPDDEAGGFGGTLCLYADRGVQTSVVCLTPGQAATNRGGAKDDHELAAMRRKEFAASCEVLKVSYGIVLDYPDGKLHRMDLYRVVCDLTLEIRKFRPHVVMTFGPEGGLTGHTDHAMAGVFASLAFQWAGRNNRFPDQVSDRVSLYQPKKLYYATADYGIPGRPPITLPPATATIEIGDLLATKIKAFKMHTSQSPLWPLFEQNISQRAKKEMFHLAASIKSGPVELESDLFTGIPAED
jgi:LmbE family N-acetylglucosaminyl deacetylase